MKRKRLTSALASAVCLCLFVWGGGGGGGEREKEAETILSNFCPCLNSLPMFVCVGCGMILGNAEMQL